MRKLDPDDVRPPFRQLAGRLSEAIEAGEYPPGARLPSYGQLAEIFEVAVGTVKRAVGVLREDGQVVTRHGMGTYVRATALADDEPDDGLSGIRAQLAEFRQRLEAIERQLAEMR